jgi:hypothetical protein
MAGAGFAAALALGACRGPDVISLGAATRASGTMLYISPDGSDLADGSHDHPLLTFKFALPLLAPGATLSLLPGTYEDATTGTLNVKCATETANSAAPDAILAPNGTTAMPITVTAEPERQAFLRGNGRVPPITLDACTGWTIEKLHARSSDAADAPDLADAGSVVVLGSDNHDVTLSDLLLTNPNLYKRSNVMRIGDRSSRVTVVGCELYDFPDNGFETWRTSSIYFQRNYINSRGTADRDDGYHSGGDGTQGDYGVFLEETSNVFAENNIIEGVHDGFGIMGRDKNVVAPPTDETPGSNHLLGNIVYEPAGVGFRLDSRCQKQAMCEPARTVTSTELGGNVVVGGSEGVSDAGSVDTRIHELSVINAARGVALVKEPQNAGLQATSMTTNALVVGFQAVAFQAGGETGWSWSNCATMGGNTSMADYVPPERISGAVTVDPGLGTCLAYLPLSSPLKGIGVGNDIGANVLKRYDKGTLTADLLWDATTGAFPCGAPVAGVNDDADPTKLGCISVHHRLHVGPLDGCPLP